MNCEALICDMGNVLIKIKNPPVEAFRQHVTKPLSLEKITEILYPSPSQIGLADIHDRFHTGRIPSLAFYNHVQNQLGLQDLTFEQFEILWPDRFEVDEEALEMVRKIRVNKRFMLSDTNPLDYQWLRGHHPEIFEPFDILFLSHERHTVKESDQAWMNVLAETQLLPGQCIYIDDREDFGRRAEGLGIPSIVHTSVATTSATLKARGLLYQQ